MRGFIPRFLRLLENLRPESIFLGLGIVFGLVFCVASVPFMVPDEIAHFYRAYQVSELKVFSDVRSYYDIGGEIPASLPELASNFDGMIYHPKIRIPAGKIVELFKLSLHPKDRDFIGFKNTAVYFPTAYLSQAAGILFGRFIQAPVMLVFYLGRVFNLAAWLALTWWAIRDIPILKWALLTLALMPMTISQAASLSPDALLNGLAFLFVARLLRTVFRQEEQIRSREIILWVSLLVMLTLIKPVYLALGLGMLWIERRRFGSWRRYMLALVFTAGIPFLIYLGWQSLLGSRGIVGELDPRISAPLQIQFILSDWPGFLRLLARTFSERVLPLMVMAVGYFGWLDQPQPEWFYPLYFIYAFVITILDHCYTDIKVKASPRIVSAGTVLITVLAIAMTIYVFSNRVGNANIEGIQGRYFIPLGILLSIILYNIFPRIQSRWLGLIASAGSVFFMVIAILTLASRIQF